MLRSQICHIKSYKSDSLSFESKGCKIFVDDDTLPIPRIDESSLCDRAGLEWHQIVDILVTSDSSYDVMIATIEQLREGGLDIGLRRSSFHRVFDPW